MPDLLLIANYFCEKIVKVACGFTDTMTMLSQNIELTQEKLSKSIF